MNPQPHRFPAAPPATSESALEATFKAKMEEIELQRDEERAAMSNRLYFLVMEYRRRDQWFVDRYTECLEQLSRRLPAIANTSLWAKPCSGVADQESFFQGGLAIKICPATHSGLPHPHGHNTKRETATVDDLPTTTTAASAGYPRPTFSPSSSSSPLSSVPCSPEPTSKLAPVAREIRPYKHLKRPPSPDELAYDPSSSPLVAAGKKTNRSRISQQMLSCKPLPTHDRMLSAQPAQSSSTSSQQPSTISPRSPPVPKIDRRLPCLECRRRRLKCSRGKPRCSQCKRKGKPCEYLVPKPTSASSQGLKQAPGASEASFASET